MGETHSCSAPAGIWGTHKRIHRKDQRSGKKQPGQQGNLGQSHWEGAARSPKGRGQQSRADSGRAKHLHQHPAYSTWTLNRGRQHDIRMHCQHPPKPARFNKSLLPRATCPSAPGTSPAPARLPSTRDHWEGCSSLPSRGEGQRDRPCPGYLPLLPGQAAPPCSSSYKRALNPCNPLDTNYSNLSTLDPELQQAHKELCLPGQFTLLQDLKQTTAED